MVRAEFSPRIVVSENLDCSDNPPSHLSHERVLAEHQIKQCLEGGAVAHFSPSSDLPGHVPCMNLHTKMEGKMESRNSFLTF